MIFCLLSQCNTANFEKEKIEKCLFGDEVLLTSPLLDSLKSKRIGIVTNHTAVVFDRVHLVDTLLQLGFNIQAIFTPEHGFWGRVPPGESVAHQSYRGIPVYSLYGKDKAPRLSWLQSLDVILWDIQDVGARFYTYITTLGLCMEACAKAKVPIWILDRPNPNGFYVAGPVLDTAYRSFVGWYPIPVVYGLTVGELARMMVQKRWIAQVPRYRVIAMVGYRHDFRWEQLQRRWIAPSPNLRSVHAAMLYPLLCWFEGTLISVGRGTDSAFTIIGAPFLYPYQYAYKKDSIENTTTLMNIYNFILQPIRFIPRKHPAAPNPKWKNQVCYGVKIAFTDSTKTDDYFKLTLHLLKRCYESYQAYRKHHPQAPPFFKPYFTYLVGNSWLQKAIENNEPIEAIQKRWMEELRKFKKERKRFLLYP